MKDEKTTGKKPKTKERTQTFTPYTDGGASRPVMTVDFEYYEEKYLRDYDISDEQKREFIAAFAGLMMAFVDLGFGIEPGFLLCKDGKKDRDKPGDFSSKNPGNPLYSRELSNTFNEQDAAVLRLAKESDS